MGAVKSKMGKDMRHILEVTDPKLKEKLERVIGAWDDPDNLDKEEVKQLAADAKEQGFSTSLIYYDLLDPKMKQKTMEFLLMKEAGQLVKELEEIIEYLDKCHRKVSIAHVIGRSVEVVGSTLSFSGMVVMAASAFILLPVAIPLLAAGAILKFVGSVTRCGADVAESWKIQQKTERFDQRYQRLLADYGDYVALHQINAHIPRKSVLKVLKRMGVFGDLVTPVVSLVYAVQAGISLDKSCGKKFLHSVGQSLGPCMTSATGQVMTGAAAQAVSTTGAMVTAGVLAYDIGMLVKDAVHLAKNEPTEQAVRLRNVMERLQNIANGHWDRERSAVAKIVTTRHIARLFAARRRKNPVKGEREDNEDEEAPAALVG